MRVRGAPGDAGVNLLIRLPAGVEQAACDVFNMRAHGEFGLHGVARSDRIQNIPVLLRVMLPSLRREYRLTKLAPCPLPSYSVEAVEDGKQEPIACDQTQRPVKLSVPGLPRSGVSRGPSLLNKSEHIRDLKFARAQSRHSGNLRFDCQSCLQRLGRARVCGNERQLFWCFFGTRTNKSTLTDMTPNSSFRLEPVKRHSQSHTTDGELTGQISFRRQPTLRLEAIFPQHFVKLLVSVVGSLHFRPFHIGLFWWAGTQ